ncbi:carboxypeptidase-like regulatory domain-containing protein [Myroides pelagicus]|nr:carboxypeptidase-like regulatory domain-containing protein [Myroides pelagicus]
MAQKGSKASLQASVVDSQTGTAIAFATVVLTERQLSLQTDINGQFTIEFNGQTSLSLQISSLGYMPKSIVIKPGEEHLVIALALQSIGLSEVVVSASYTNPLTSEAKVDQQALEYINPISVGDIFVLLPGGMVRPNTINTRELISSRQVGSDKSTSFGMGVTVDGVPMQNDGYRLQMAGITGSNANLTTNTGVDLRTLSTDHIQQVEINKGISSASQGNLSSGNIKITSKKGKSPLRTRVKFDPLNKFAYIGKGMLLSPKLGTLYAGLDYISSSNDLREVKSAYQRITGQLNYDNQFAFWGKSIDFNLRGSYVSSFKNRKDDEVIRLKGENYKTSYTRYGLSANVVANIHSPIVDEVTFKASVDYTSDLLEHYKKVENVSVQISPSALEAGEHEASYLPQQYYTFYAFENKPMNAYTSLSANKFLQLSEYLSMRVLVGTNLTYTKNKGAGVIVDPTRPPYPSSTFTRPRSNASIPALIHQAAYAETKLRYVVNTHEWNASLGVRTTSMYNLPKDYLLASKLLIEPRLQLAYTHSKTLADQALLINSFRIGFGIENKLPSIDFLYPDKVYQDFVAFNGYFTEEHNRYVLINTHVLDPLNSNVRENKNKKIELGWDMKYKKLSLSITAFKEQMNGGVEYFSIYEPVAYTAYKLKDSSIDHKPTKDDLDPYQKRDFTINSTPVNSAKVVKKGIEYRLFLSKVEAIASDIEINGAYYHTLYTSGVPVMHRPAITNDNNLYPYVGYYDGFDKQYNQRFNTNVWINTHLPVWKLIFSNFVQITWLDTYRLGDNVSKYPSRIMDLDGNTREITPQEIEGNPAFSALMRSFSSAMYNKERLPISMLWNVKLTKEFNKHVKLSFFANNLLQLSPSYKTKFQRTQRRALAPFFGSELIVNLF